MNLTKVSFLLGIIFTVAYAVLYLYRRRKPPNLGALFLLFMCGPPIEEAWAIIYINWQIFIEGQAVQTGVFSSHLYVIAFSAIALVYSVAYTVFSTFAAIDKASD